MTRAQGSDRPSPWGWVETRPSPGGGGEGRLIWRPAEAVAAHLPPQFGLALAARTGPDGRRRFVPGGPVEAFLLEASLGGLALLAEARGLDAGARSGYDARRLVYQHAPRMRESFGRAFRVAADLAVPRGERAGLGARDVLPAELGLDRDGRGARWGVAELLRRGRAEAVAAGDPDPDPARCIAAGLLAAARRNPLDPAALTAAGARVLVRMALFDAGPAGPVDPDVRGAVHERLLAAIRGWGGLDGAAFRARFVDGRDGLIRRIAKQRRGVGPVPRSAVRRALWDLTVEAFESVGDCVGLQMRAFLAALPGPPDDWERAWFEAVYLPGPHLGGLPLILLWERFDFLKGAVLDVWKDPGSPGPVGVLLRLLSYYEAMATARRAADRASKGRRPRPGPVGIVRVAPPGGAAAAPRAAARGDRFREVVAALRGGRGPSCPCPDPGAWEARLADDGDAGDVLAIALECGRCGRTERFDVPRAAFARAGRSIPG